MGMIVDDRATKKGSQAQCDTLGSLSRRWHLLGPALCPQYLIHNYQPSELIPLEEYILKAKITWY